jgi:hypothetical protein
MKRTHRFDFIQGLESLTFETGNPFPVSIRLPDDAVLRSCPICESQDLCFWVSPGKPPAGFAVKCDACIYVGNAAEDWSVALEKWNDEISQNHWVQLDGLWRTRIKAGL